MEAEATARYGADAEAIYDNGTVVENPVQNSTYVLGEIAKSEFGQNVKNLNPCRKQSYLSFVVSKISMLYRKSSAFHWFNLEVLTPRYRHTVLVTARHKKRWRA